MAPSLPMEVLESMRLLAHGEAVRRAWKRDEAAIPAAGAMLRRILMAFVWVGIRAAPFALVALAWIEGTRTLYGWKEGDSPFTALFLHALSLVWIWPTGMGLLRAHEALRMPGRRALLLARWLRWVPRALTVSASWIAYQLLKGEWWSQDSGMTTLLVWYAMAPQVLAGTATWSQIRDAASAECQVTAGLLRITLGVVAFIVVTLGLSAAVHAESPVVWFFGIPTVLSAVFGGATLFYGVRSLVGAHALARIHGFSPLVLMTDLLTPLVAAASVLWSAMVALSGRPLFRNLTTGSGFPWIAVSVGFAVALWIYGIQRFFWSREVAVPLRKRPQGVDLLDSAEFGSSRSYPTSRLTAPPPRGFGAARAFRRRVAIPPVLRWVILGFMTFCIWVAFMFPPMCWAAILGVLIFPRLVGIEVSERIQLLGVGYREQHLRNLLVLVQMVLLPAVVLLALLQVQLVGEPGYWVVGGVTVSSILLRAGLVGPWRWLRAHGLPVGFTPLLIAVVALPILALNLGRVAGSKNLYEYLALIFAVVGALGLGLHLATLDEGRLRDEMRREAERR